MATRVMSSDRARMVLAIFEKFGGRLGDKMVLSDLVTIGATQGMMRWEIDVGLDLGREQGWFEVLSDSTVRLTENGSAAREMGNCSE